MAKSWLRSRQPTGLTETITEAVFLRYARLADAECAILSIPGRGGRLIDYTRYWPMVEWKFAAGWMTRLAPRTAR